MQSFPTYSYFECGKQFFLVSLLYEIKEESKNHYSSKNLLDKTRKNTNTQPK